MTTVDIFRSSSIDPETTERINDAAAVLQLKRSQIASRLKQGAFRGARVVGVGTGINRWMLHASRSWRENLSARPSANTRGLRVSLPNNRACVRAGQRMVSIFDERLDLDAKLLLAGETQPRYQLSAVPVQMKLINHEFVLLQGPQIGNESSVMAVDEPACLEAAWRYWELVQEAAYDCTAEVAGLADLTSRQRQIVALLSADAHDEAIARTLGISVRTVRSDIANLMDILGVKSRFAAGQRLTLAAQHGQRIESR